MKKFMVIATMLLTLSVSNISAQSKSKSVVPTFVAKKDTMKVINSKITRVIEDPYVTSKGAQRVRYYMVYDGNLISTSKTVVEKYNLAKKYGVNIALAIVNNKRIILD